MKNRTKNRMKNTTKNKQRRRQKIKSRKNKMKRNAKRTLRRGMKGGNEDLINFSANNYNEYLSKQKKQSTPKNGNEFDPFFSNIKSNNKTGYYEAIAASFPQNSPPPPSQPQPLTQSQNNPPHKQPEWLKIEEKSRRKRLGRQFRKTRNNIGRLRNSVKRYIPFSFPFSFKFNPQPPPQPPQQSPPDSILEEINLIKNFITNNYIDYINQGVISDNDIFNKDIFKNILEILMEIQNKYKFYPSSYNILSPLFVKILRIINTEINVIEKIEVTQKKRILNNYKLFLINIRNKTEKLFGKLFRMMNES